MFRKTLTALVAIAGLSFAGAAFAEEANTAPEKPAATATVKPGAKVSHKKVSKVAKASKTEAKSTGQAQTVDMSKQPKAQPRTHKKIVRQNTNKKSARAGSMVKAPASTQNVAK